MTGLSSVETSEAELHTATAANYVLAHFFVLNEETASGASTNRGAAFYVTVWQVNDLAFVKYLQYLVLALLIRTSHRGFTATFPGSQTLPAELIAAPFLCFADDTEDSHVVLISAIHQGLATRAL